MLLLIIRIISEISVDLADVSYSAVGPVSVHVSKWANPLFQAVASIRASCDEQAIKDMSLDAQRAKLADELRFGSKMKLHP